MAVMGTTPSLATGHLLRPRWQDVGSVPTSDFQQTMLGVLIFFTALAVVIYGFRMHVRIKTKQVGIDDWLITVATVFNVAQMITLYMFFRYSYVGFPAASVPVDTYDPTPGLFWEFLMEIFYNPLLALVKSSVLCFLLKIGGCKPGVKITIHIVNAINVAEMIALFLAVVLQTLPVRAAWDSSVTATHRIDLVPFIIATAAITITTDIIVLAIPVWIFMGLHLRMAKKVGIIIIFLAGGVVTAISCVRLNVLHRAFTDLTFDYTNSWGPAYAGIESNLAIITACVPALWPLIAKWMPKYASRTTKASGGQLYPASTVGAGVSGRSRAQYVKADEEEGDAFQLKTMGETRTDIRGHSPQGSEDEIMRYNGIVRTVQYDVSYNQRATPVETERSSLESIAKAK